MSVRPEPDASRSSDRSRLYGQAYHDLMPERVFASLTERELSEVERVRTGEAGQSFDLVIKYLSEGRWTGPVALAYLLARYPDKYTLFEYGPAVLVLELLAWDAGHPDLMRARKDREVSEEDLLNQRFASLCAALRNARLGQRRRSLMEDLEADWDRFLAARPGGTSEAARWSFAEVLSDSLWDKWDLLTLDPEGHEVLREYFIDAGHPELALLHSPASLAEARAEWDEEE